MKLENKTIWLTGDEFDPGPLLNELEMEVVYNHIQSKLYYKEGIKEFEDIGFTHNDIHRGNVLKDPKTNSYKIIDPLPFNIKE